MEKSKEGEIADVKCPHTPIVMAVKLIQYKSQISTRE